MDEMNLRNWFNMIKVCNPILNLIYVDSLLCPRHVRVTMLFSNIILLWFWSAVFYNNTKDPLDIPDYSKKARWVALEEIWIAMVAPWGTMALMFIFWAFFKITDHRLRQADP